MPHAPSQTLARAVPRDPRLHIHAADRIHGCERQATGTVGRRDGIRLVNRMRHYVHGLAGAGMTVLGTQRAGVPQSYYLFHPSTRYLWIGFDAEFFGRIGSESPEV